MFAKIIQGGGGGAIKFAFQKRAVDFILLKHKAPATILTAIFRLSLLTTNNVSALKT